MNKATLVPVGKKWTVKFNQGELENEILPTDRIRAKRFLFLLKESGFKCYNQKKGGAIVEV